MRTPKPILERRRSVRVDDELPFKIGHQDFEIYAKTINISEHGALCLVGKNIPLMTQLAIALTLPSGKKGQAGKAIKMKGVVVRRETAETDRFILAIFFSDIKSSDRDTLRRYIESRVSTQG